MTPRTYEFALENISVVYVEGTDRNGSPRKIVRACVWEHNLNGPNRGNDIRGGIRVTNESVTLQSQQGVTETDRWMEPGAWERSESLSDVIAYLWTGNHEQGGLHKKLGVALKLLTE
tara:strand:- start:866 stop:1216 length:351 start_codon:yes stop_codon:yes gene_type:complete